RYRDSSRRSRHSIRTRESSFSHLFCRRRSLNCSAARISDRRLSVARRAVGSFTSGARGTKHVAGMPTPFAEFKQIGIVYALRSCQLFAGISPPELNAIAEFTVVKSVPKGAYLFHEGDVSAGFYIVQTGAINVHRVNAAGKEQVIHVFRAGESFAEGTLATDKGYPADARAVEASQVLLVQKADI